MRPGRVAREILAVCAVVAVFWPAPRASAGDAPRPAAVSVSARVTSASVRVGDRARLEISVRTPPDHRLLPLALPPYVGEFVIDSVEDLPLVEGADAWVHRRIVHFRPRSTGMLTWPEIALAVEGPGAVTSTAVGGPVPVEVISVLDRFAGRGVPFGARSAPPASSEARSVALRMLGWASLASLALAAGIVARRRHLHRRDRARVVVEKPWARALRELGEAGALSHAPAAAHAAATALRHYMQQRFRAETRARTAEELASARPPYGATSRWPAFTALMLELDALRFSRTPGGGDATTQPPTAAELLTRARAFVESTVPPEALQ